MYDKSHTIGKNRLNSPEIVLHRTEHRAQTTGAVELATSLSSFGHSFKAAGKIFVLFISLSSLETVCKRTEG